MGISTLRKISQAVFLTLFLYLFVQTESKGYDELGYPVKIFLDFDPLIFLSTILSSRNLLGAFYLSVITVVITVFLGRIFCGWVCPLGTLNNIVSSFKKILQISGSGNIGSLRRPELYRVKYYLLFFILIGSMFTVQFAGIFDPLSLLIRSLSVSIYPAFNYAVRSIFEGIYSLDIKALTAITEPVYSLLKKTLLSFEQPFYRQGFFIGALFILILGLNLVERRFWCKYICPLGALLGILSRFGILQRSVSEGCNSCGVCVRNCQGASLIQKAPSDIPVWKKRECLYCFNCDDLCPQKVVRFGISRKDPAFQAPTSLDLTRRGLVISISTAILSVPLIRIAPFTKEEYINPRLIRPPGAQEEREFLRRCVRCGECMKVCITNGLQPALFDGGLETLWTPVLIPKMGYCEYKCTLCGQVCPTGAIKRLSFEEKAKTKIGLAMIDKSRCLPYAHGRTCIVCEEVCPTPKKAIWLEKAFVKTRDGETIQLQQPHVDLELCIGCGICEAKCPVVDRPAIYATNIGESRSKTNQLLLDS